MAPLSSTVDLSLGGAAEALGWLGIPNPFEWFKDVDGDPDQIHDSYQPFTNASQDVKAGSEELKSGQGSLAWSGSTSDAFKNIVDGIVTGFLTFVELLLWLPEVALQIIDWLLDAVRWAINLLVLLVTILTAIYVVAIAVIAALAASVVGSPGIPGVISAAIEAAWGALEVSWIAWLGGLAFLLGVLAFFLKLIDWIIEKVIDFTQWCRKGLGDRLPTVPDWDPENPPNSLPS
jgi:hypothetical protein